MRENTRRQVLLVVQYDGTDFFGFQRQPGLPTIQSELEDALSQLLGEVTNGFARGRVVPLHAVVQTRERALDLAEFSSELCVHF